MFKKIIQWWHKHENPQRDYIPLGNTFRIAAEAGWIVTSPTDLHQAMTAAFRNGEISTYGISSTDPMTGEQEFTDVHVHAKEFSKWLVDEIQKRKHQVLH